MSATICLDPRANYNFTTLTCETQPDQPAGPIPNQESLASFSVAALSPSAPRAKSLEDFKKVLLPIAASGSGLPKSQFNPFSLSLFAFLPFGCGDSNSSNLFKKNEKYDASTGSGGENSGGTGGTGGATAGTGGSSGSSAIDGGDGGADSGSTEGILEPGIPFATTPCGSDGTIPDLDQDVGVCANYSEDKHHLFSWDPENMSTMDGGSNSILQLGFAPDQVLKGTNGKYFITHHGDLSAVPPSPTGLAVIDTAQSMQSQVDFSKIVLGSSKPTSSGTTTTQVSPSFPKGLAQVGQRLFIATSNLVTRALAKDNYYNPGTVLIFNTQLGTWEHFLTTTDFNPTSLAVVNGKVYVVNSGDINPARDGAQLVTTPSSIDVINPQTLVIEKNIPLGMPPSGTMDGGMPKPMDGSAAGMMDGSTPTTPSRENVAAGIQGEIALSPDGQTLVLPTGDNSGRLIVLDLTTQSTRYITVATGEKVLLTGLSFHPAGEYLYVGNFNDGKIYTIDLKTGQVDDQQSLDSDTTNFSGISDGLWQGGAVFMGVGPEIYRIPAKY